MSGQETRGAGRAKPSSPKKRIPALLLCLTLGAAGMHRFYVGRNKSAVLWILTGGLFGVGVLADYILLAAGRFRDVDGLRLRR